MGSLTIDDSVKSVSMTVSDALSSDDPKIVSYLQILDQMNAIAPISSVSWDNTGDAFTITLKDARTMTMAVQTTPFQGYKFTSTAFWRDQEFDTMQALADVLIDFYLNHGLSVCTVTYA